MSKMKAVSPHSLTGDLGWHLRDVYADTISDLDKYNLFSLFEQFAETLNTHLSVYAIHNTWNFFEKMLI